MTRHLTYAALFRVARRACGDDVVVRDAGLLESALARPRAAMYGHDAYPALFGKAAALLHSLVSNHGLVDGNKRLGWLAGAVFLRINGFDLDAPEDEAFELVMGVADGSIDDVEIIAESLRAWSTPRAQAPRSGS
ncbi:MAG TPA: type II toxin-antitoxin system death-on-curing family toxin [Pseudonocardia sp.]